jgi:hypothetical protein
LKLEEEEEKWKIKLKFYAKFIYYYKLEFENKLN